MGSGETPLRIIESRGETRGLINTFYNLFIVAVHGLINTCHVLLLLLIVAMYTTMAITQISAHVAIAMYIRLSTHDCTYLQISQQCCS